MLDVVWVRGVGKAFGGLQGEREDCSEEEGRGRIMMQLLGDRPGSVKGAGEWTAGVGGDSRGPDSVKP